MIDSSEARDRQWAKLRDTLIEGGVKAEYQLEFIRLGFEAGWAGCEHEIQLQQLEQMTRAIEQRRDN